MYDCSSRVCGSMIWYSSSTPIVREGGFIVLVCLPFFDEEGRHGRPASSRHVQQRSRRESRQVSFHVLTVAHEWCRVEHPVYHLHRPVHHARVGLIRNAHALLND